MYKKKRIGIVTCSREVNYGACLQAFATLLILENNGYDAEILNYSFETIKSYSPIKQRSIRSFIASLLFYCLRKKQYLSFQQFHKKMKFSSKELRNSDDYFIAKDDFDVLLVGSDQVWNPYLGFDLNLSLLCFYDDGPRRVSYATSFGVSELPANMENKYKEAFKRFDSISTREVQGCSIVEKLLNKRVKVVLDPALLLSAEEWNAHAETHSESANRYVLIYDQNHSKELIPVAQKISKERGIKVYVLSSIRYNNPCFKNLYGISPANFLDIIRRAEYVVTDSFHGAVFSIIYHRQFSICCGGSATNLSSRITNLLNEFKLENRWITNNLPNEEFINYSEVDSILVRRRYESIEYLKNAIDGKRERHPKDNSLKVTCSGCGLCKEICPNNAIKLKPDSEGFSYPHIDAQKCTKCGRCYAECPHIEFVSENPEVTPVSFIARCKDKKILMDSSSGGIFSVFSDYFLHHENVVYGAAFDHAFAVKHIRATDSKGRNSMRGSKYVQSDIGSVYEAIANDLQGDRKVLFTGTPCQCLAVKQYINNVHISSEKLYLCDLVCHGVSSPSVWNDYLQLIEKEYGRIESIKFRNKGLSNGYNMTISTDKTIYMREDIADPYIYIFSHNLAIRPSCINCKFKTLKRVSDMTIGDFQGVAQVYPKYNDNMGVSVVLINTESGKSLFDSISELLEYEKCSISSAMQINLVRNTVSTAQRNGFLELYKSKGYERAIKNYTEANISKHLLGQCKRTIKRTLSKIGLLEVLG